MGRNQTRTELQLTIRTNLVLSALPDFLLGIVSKQGIELKRMPYNTAEVDETGRPICLYTNVLTNRYFVFDGAGIIPHESGTIVKFAPDTAVFFISGATSRVFRTTDPHNPIIDLPENFAPQEIFTQGDKIYVFGQKLGLHASPGDPSVCCGLVFSRREHGFDKESEIDLHRFGAVLDMDEASETLLVDSKRDLFRTWGLYNPATHKYKSLGLARGRGFFLEKHFADYLETLWKKK